MSSTLPLYQPENQMTDIPGDMAPCVSSRKPLFCADYQQHLQVIPPYGLLSSPNELVKPCTQFESLIPLFVRSLPKAGAYGRNLAC